MNAINRDHKNNFQQVPSDLNTACGRKQPQDSPNTNMPNMVNTALNGERRVRDPFAGKTSQNEGGKKIIKGC